MNTLESKIEKKACALILEYLGIHGSKLTTPGDTGYPDRIFWLPGGRPLLIEFKRPGELPSEKQLKVHKTLKSLGYLVEVCDDALDALMLVVEVLCECPLSEEESYTVAEAINHVEKVRGRG